MSGEAIGAVKRDAAKPIESMQFTKKSAPVKAQTPNSPKVEAGVQLVKEKQQEKIAAALQAMFAVMEANNKAGMQDPTGGTIKHGAVSSTVNKLA